MPTNRSHDRHRRNPDGTPLRPARIFRPNPPDLWSRLGDAVGKRNRSDTISTLISRYLNGDPMPPLPPET